MVPPRMDRTRRRAHAPLHAAHIESIRAPAINAGNVAGVRPRNRVRPRVPHARAAGSRRVASRLPQAGAVQPLPRARGVPYVAGATDIPPADPRAVEGQLPRAVLLLGAGHGVHLRVAEGAHGRGHRAIVDPGAVGAVPRDPGAAPVLRPHPAELAGASVSAGVHGDTPSTPALFKNLSPHLDALHKLIATTPSIPPTSQPTFLQALSRLKATSACIEACNARQPLEVGMLYMWPLSLEEEFFAFLQQRHPVALVFLAFYCAQLHAFRQYWFVGGQGGAWLECVEEALDGGYGEFLAWPRGILSGDV
ncbi:uncharacterized protein DSM5745_07755 [Aspergillus mulundensis]|uniref:Uncharacterized protein n=1 Tax=Aspergillus mulundensis TaxID=1810919 RepID=A0A3D8REU4_9EURO|nr:hypothetical protein DSM5745_07755 [Aspergillus mulundensis]RDW72583.1 hypothetical protein DSM5745_07755 [Aspergillus mulundensis]